ncbi:MAG: hypothetical protein NZ920_00730 [Aigarchaeota archaeon]|nr:hypothetical protein [Aigarchaeota archaeon]MDW8092967.1 hypothetical protein [Nitrososphaerota archaeon]
MGRKRRKIIKRQSKPFPRLFVCPICNLQSVTVTKERLHTATVSCSSCGNSLEVPWYRSFMPVDAYSIWYDVVTGRKTRDMIAKEVEEALTTYRREEEGESAEPLEGEAPVDEGEKQIS